MPTQEQADQVGAQILLAIGEDNFLRLADELPEFYFEASPEAQLAANRAMLAKAVRNPVTPPALLAEAACNEFYCQHGKKNVLHPDYEYRCPECDREEVADLE